MAVVQTLDGSSLGTWLTMQRMKRRSGKLKDYQIRTLDELGMSWEMHTDWDKRFRVRGRAYHTSCICCNQDSIISCAWASKMHGTALARALPAEPRRSRRALCMRAGGQVPHCRLMYCWHAGAIDLPRHTWALQCASKVP
jgi:hypothetical protein